MSKWIEINGQQFEKLTCTTDAKKYVEMIKDDCVCGDEDDGLYSDNSLYIEYKDGSYVCLFEGDPVAKLKKTGIKMFILDADWGTAFYNAYPQMDRTYPDSPYIRIGCEPGEYGESVEL